MTNPWFDRAFSAAVSEVYDEVLVPMIFNECAKETSRMCGHVQSGSVLEIAAGTGVVTRAMAASLPRDVSLTATDLNQTMIDRAMLVGTARPVEWRWADVMALPVADDSVDLAVCQFGVMFFEPKSDAFAEVRRVLRPGGRYLFSVWDGLEDNEFADVVARSVAGLFSDDPPSFFERTPYGYHEQRTIVDDVTVAGFASPPTFERRSYTSRAATAREVATAFCAGTPLRSEIEQRHPGGLAEAVDVATEAVAHRFGRRDLEGRISAQFVSVEK
jgi:SAM-dependent methyltransferase